jgi:hypothetical protein
LIDRERVEAEHARNRASTLLWCLGLLWADFIEEAAHRADRVPHIRRVV